MLYLFTGTDRKKARAAMHAAIKKNANGVDVIHISDASTVGDLQFALAGRGMFDPPVGGRVIVLDSTLSNPEMRELVLATLSPMSTGEDAFFMLEEKPDAATRRSLERHAKTSERFDAAKRAQDNSIFALKNALVQGDKKKLWIGLCNKQRKVVCIFLVK